jgi:adenine-specific DNA-methyltransferase
MHASPPRLPLRVTHSSPPAMAYRDQKLLVYLGNKRKLVPWIEESVERVKRALGKDRLVAMDGFCGSTAVARMLAEHAAVLHTNDFERYSRVLQECALVPLGCEDARSVFDHVAAANALMDAGPLVEGIVSTHYAPRDTEDIKAGERTFFTHENALRIDTARDYIARCVPERLQPYVLGPLIIECCGSANTQGYMQAAHKTWGGGSGRQARTMRPFVLDQPVTNPHPVEVTCHSEDTTGLLRRLDGVAFDLVYLDPVRPADVRGALLLRSFSRSRTTPRRMGVITASSTSYAPTRCPPT